MQKYNKISLEFLSNVAGTESIKDFYLSDGQYVNRFFDTNSSSFIFDGFALFLCIEGSGCVKISGREYTLSKGSILLYTPNQLMEKKYFSEDIVRKSIVVSIDLLMEIPSPIDANILNLARHSPVINVSDKMMSHLCEYYYFIEQQYHEIDNPYRKEISKTLLYALILEVCAIYQSANNEMNDNKLPRQEEIFDEFILLLGKHYKKERAIAYYADKLNLTPKYLSTNIKQISGRSAAEWIREIVVCEIKTLLKTTNYTISQISDKLNFSSTPNFVQYFKQYAGITPHQYRKSE